MKQTPSDPHRYSKPELRDQIKKQIMEGDKGGKPGQWSARKAQLVAREYEAAGGEYKEKKSAPQKSLEAWGEEKWRTEDGNQADREGGMTRYLPDASWEKLSPTERAATNRKKREGSKQGKQFVANTEAAAEARKKAVVSKAGNKAPARKAPARKAPAPAKKTSTARPKSTAQATAKKNATPKKQTSLKKTSPGKTSGRKTSRKSSAKKSP